MQHREPPEPAVAADADHRGVGERPRPRRVARADRERGDTEERDDPGRDVRGAPRDRRLELRHDQQREPAAADAGGAEDPCANGPPPAERT